MGGGQSLERGVANTGVRRVREQQTVVSRLKAPVIEPGDQVT